MSDPSLNIFHCGTAPVPVEYPLPDFRLVRRLEFTTAAFNPFGGSDGSGSYGMPVLQQAIRILTGSKSEIVWRDIETAYEPPRRGAQAQKGPNA